MLPNDNYYQDSTTPDVSEAERLIVEAMAEHLNSMGIETSTDWEEGQRIIDAITGESEKNADD